MPGASNIQSNQTGPYPDADTRVHKKQMSIDVTLKHHNRKDRGGPKGLGDLWKVGENSQGMVAEKGNVCMVFV